MEDLLVPVSDLKAQTVSHSKICEKDSEDK